MHSACVCALFACVYVILVFLDNPLEFVGIREHVVDDLRRRNVERVARALRKGDSALGKGPLALSSEQRKKKDESDQKRT